MRQHLALATAADTLRNTALQRDVHEALALVREGALLAAALATRPALAGLLVTFARLGEQTGQLDYAAARRPAAGRRRPAPRAGDHVARAAADHRHGRHGAAVVLAVMLPIIQLNQLVR